MPTVAEAMEAECVAGHVKGLHLGRGFRGILKPAFKRPFGVFAHLCGVPFADKDWGTPGFLDKLTGWRCVVSVGHDLERDSSALIEEFAVLLEEAGSVGSMEQQVACITFQKVGVLV